MAKAHAWQPEMFFKVDTLANAIAFYLFGYISDERLHQPHYQVAHDAVKVFYLFDHFSPYKNTLQQRK